MFIFIPVRQGISSPVEKLSCVSPHTLLFLGSCLWMWESPTDCLWLDAKSISSTSSKIRDVSGGNRRECSAYWAHPMGLTPMLEQKSLQSQCLWVPATAAADLRVSNEYELKQGYKGLEGRWESFFGAWGKKLQWEVQIVLSASLFASILLQGQQSSMSHDRECQACWAGAGCIICLLLASIWMPGEELWYSLLSQGNCGPAPLWAAQQRPPWLEHYEDSL